MKHTLLAAALATTAAFSFSSAFAADGTVNFTGSVTDTACVVDMGGSNALSVPMGKISKTSFGASGSLAGATKFTLKLKTCPTATTATVKFDGIAAGGDDKILALTGGAGAATGLGIQISDKSGNVLPLATNSVSYTLAKGDASVPANDVTNDLDFTARYISTAATVSAGSANATATFSINYN
ncbi:type 1 fimbrial protein [Serratia proteamaculans]|uniref:fimbrial protein n=1 Tax=Serratia proteamaculans TaxID=28151 RepID=UPI001575F56F|nr:fimbrial protein [Serratia proteamaculans]NTX79281.1 type 1 fimbrial protein [Serratia proteamaculans]NTZ26478.1 type 1 fimbrial protein [Serratia proteamaculans]